MIYGQLVDGNLVYFHPYKGGIHVGNKVVFTTKEKVYNKYGWYRVEVIADDGEDYQDGNVIYHYIGKVEDEQVS